MAPRPVKPNDGKKCVRCDKPRGYRCTRYCTDCSAELSSPRRCSRCNEPKPVIKGRQYCDDCRDLEDWKTNRLRAIHVRKTCRDCHGPKPPGRGLVYCPACLRRRKENPPVAPPRICPDCNVNPVQKRRIYCEKCRGRRFVERKERQREKDKAWRASTPISERPKRKPSAKPEPLVPALQLGEALHRLGLRMAGLQLADRVEGGSCGHKEICTRAGIFERTAFGWRAGEREETRLSSAEDVMNRVGLFWWDVWNPDTVRRHAFELVVYRNVRADRTIPLGPWTTDAMREWIADPGSRKLRPVGIKRIRLQSKGYVDLGPDLRKVKRVGRKFEGRNLRRVAA